MVVAVAGLTCWWAVQSALAAADRRADAWGTTRTVWVASRSLDAGDEWAVKAEEFPLAMVPSGGVSAAPTGVAGRSVGAGEVVTALDLSDAAPPTGWVAMALPRTGAPSLVPGDSVVVFGNGSEVCDGLAGPTVESDAASMGGTTEVWLPPDCAATVAVHLQAGTVVLARHT
ncbi:MAG TPA: hypothetical protein DCR14_18320 [Acidimicrobiaceae bacterium]|nr:hypothetical protein [Acidimicrobiaceae bacterium]